MACCSDEPVKVKENYSKRVKEGKAVIGGFLEGDGNLYAVVCFHVASTADGSFSILRKSEQENVILGAKLPKAERRKRQQQKGPYDIDIIKINSECRHHCRPVYRNTKGVRMHNFNVYQGTRQNLRGVTLYQYYMENGERICKLGQVLSTDMIPEEMNATVKDEAIFIIGNSNGEDFARDGDSGRFVAREIANGNVELVGIIFALYACRVNPEQRYTLCVLLKDGIEYLKESYGEDLSLYGIADQEIQTQEDNDIEPGQTILFQATLSQEKAK